MASRERIVLWTPETEDSGLSLFLTEDDKVLAVLHREGHRYVGTADDVPEAILEAMKGFMPALTHMQLDPDLRLPEKSSLRKVPPGVEV